MQCMMEANGEELQVKMAGQFIFSDHPEFKKVLAATEDKAIRNISVDIGAVELIDSAGLGLLLLLRDMCEKQKKELTIYRPNGQVKKVFDISKFQHLFTIEE